PVLKLQYFGPVYNELAAINTAHKYSLFPLIPPAIKGRNLEDLHNRLMNQGSDYMVLGSGAKVGVISKNGQLDKVYENYSKEMDERKPMSEDATITPNVIYVPYLKYQTHIAPNYKDEITLPTQMRALVLSDLYNYGVPVDYLKGVGEKEERIEKWNSLSDAKKKKASKIYTLERTYLKNLQDLVDIRKQMLLNEIEFKEVNGQLVGSITKLLDFIEKQLERQDISSEDLEFITQMKSGKFKDLSLSVHAEKMERMLNAIVIKRIGKPKVKGEGLIQVSNMMFEKRDSWTEARKGLSKSEKHKVYGSNDLPFYQVVKDNKGKVVGIKPMKVIISLQGDFKKLLLDEDVINLSKSENIDRL
ncbi:hypothetical protein EBX93_18735, partial [bacterium]|nr:hypothetical protein [bacterium]